MNAELQTIPPSYVDHLSKCFDCDSPLEYICLQQKCSQNKLFCFDCHRNTLHLCHRVAQVHMLIDGSSKKIPAHRHMESTKNSIISLLTQEVDIILSRIVDLQAYLNRLQIARTGIRNIAPPDYVDYISQLEQVFKSQEMAKGTIFAELINKIDIHSAVRRIQEFSKQIETILKQIHLPKSEFHFLDQASEIAKTMNQRVNPKTQQLLQNLANNSIQAYVLKNHTHTRSRCVDRRRFSSYYYGQGLFCEDILKPLRIFAEFNGHINYLKNCKDLVLESECMRRSEFYGFDIMIPEGAQRIQLQMTEFQQPSNEYEREYGGNSFHMQHAKIDLPSSIKTVLLNNQEYYKPLEIVNLGDLSNFPQLRQLRVQQCGQGRFSLAQGTALARQAISKKLRDFYFTIQDRHRLTNIPSKQQMSRYNLALAHAQILNRTLPHKYIQQVLTVLHET